VYSSEDEVVPHGAPMYKMLLISVNIRWWC